MTTNDAPYTLNQLVRVEPRLWACINRPGGVGRITKIGYCHLGYVETVNVKYIVGGGCDTMVDLAFLQPHTELARTSRSRRGREFLGTTVGEAVIEKEDQQLAARKKKDATPPTASSNNKKKKKRRTKSPEVATRTDAVAAATATAREVDTKASTKGRMTLQTGGPELRTTSKKSSAKPPVKYITIGQTIVSPLATPISLSVKRSTSAAAATAAQPKCFVVKKRPATTCTADKKQRNIGFPQQQSSRLTTSNKNKQTLLETNKKAKAQKKKETTATPSAPCNDENKKPPASWTKLQQQQEPPSRHKNSMLDTVRSPPRILPLSSRRIPLRQVFDNDMHVRNNFVETVVGEVEPKKVGAIVVDPDRQILFNQCLGQVFSKFGESVTLQALLTHVNQSLSLSDNKNTCFSNEEVDDCLAELSDRGRVMVSDGEIYKI